MNLNVAGISKYPNFQHFKLNCAKNSVTQKINSKTNNINNYSNIHFTSSFNESGLLPISYIEKYVNPVTIEKAIYKNPDIKKILLSNGMYPKIYLANIDNRLKQHLFTTYIFAKEIANRINLDSKSKEILYRSALLHDIGKGLIPEKIVQKPARLTPDERRIIDLHATLGYEILKTTDIDPKVLEAIRLHHVPAYDKDKKENIAAQILSVADVFSALKEKRAYKESLSDETAFRIMTGMEQLNQEYVEILKKA